MQVHTLNISWVISTNFSLNSGLFAVLLLFIKVPVESIDRKITTEKGKKNEPNEKWQHKLIAGNKIIWSLIQSGQNWLSYKIWFIVLFIYRCRWLWIIPWYITNYGIIVAYFVRRAFDRQVDTINLCESFAYCISMVIKSTYVWMAPLGVVPLIKSSQCSCVSKTILVANSYYFKIYELHVLGIETFSNAVPYFELRH